MIWCACLDSESTGCALHWGHWYVDRAFVFVCWERCPIGIVCPNRTAGQWVSQTDRHNVLPSTQWICVAITPVMQSSHWINSEQCYYSHCNWAWGSAFWGVLCMATPIGQLLVCSGTSCFLRFTNFLYKTSDAWYFLVMCDDDCDWLVCLMDAGKINVRSIVNNQCEQYTAAVYFTETVILECSLGSPKWISPSNLFWFDVFFQTFRDSCR